MDDNERIAHYRMMTETPVPRLIGKLAVPTIISMLVSSIYNTADTFFVSQLGTSAAGAVGIVFSVMAVIQAIGFTIGMGAGSILSRQLGAKRDEEATVTASSGFALALLLSVLLAVFGIAFSSRIMRLLGATETILPYADAYAAYIFYGCPVMCCSFVMNNYLRAEGKAVFGMIGITAGGILNIILDPIFIFTFGFGTAGAAMATALSQLISFCILLSFFIRGRSSVSDGIVTHEIIVSRTVIPTQAAKLGKQVIVTLAVTDAARRQKGCRLFQLYRQSKRILHLAIKRGFQQSATKNGMVVQSMCLRTIGVCQRLSNPPHLVQGIRHFAEHSGRARRIFHLYHTRRNLAIPINSTVVVAQEKERFGSFQGITPGLQMVLQFRISTGKGNHFSELFICLVFIPLMGSKAAPFIIDAEKRKFVRRIADKALRLGNATECLFVHPGFTESPPRRKEKISCLCRLTAPLEVCGLGNKQRVCGMHLP